MAAINTIVGFPGTISSASGGKVTAAAPSPVGQQVVGLNTARQSLIFHNPGTVALFVYPTVNAAGGVNSPSNTSLQGSFQVLPGGMLTVTGEIQTPWGAFSASGVGSLTISESNI
jgi:hypothetical protein